MNWISRFFAQRPQKVDKIYQAESDIRTGPDEMPFLQPLKVHKQNLQVHQLKAFAPLRNLDDTSLATIPHASLDYKKSTVIFTFGQNCHSVYYLLAGRVLMQPDADRNYEIAAETELACLPLNSSDQFGATVTALTNVTLLEVSVELNRLWADKSREDATCIELLDIQLPASISNHVFFDSFARAYRENKLRLPALPDVAFKLKEALQKDVSVKEAVAIIQVDASIVTKLIHVANSALYSSGTPITNCTDAVRRIGLDATRNLVMGIGLKQLFTCKDPKLTSSMYALWKNSLYVSSISFVLAKECSNINPEDALLAGLIADIGAIPLLHFAEQFEEESPTLEEIQISLPYLRGPVGALLLHTLGFSDQLTNIPHLAENWLYDSGAEMTLEDVVILAKLHSYFGSGNARNLPYINSIPAYGKVNDGRLNPDFSLRLLHKAQDRINAAKNLLA